MLLFSSCCPEYTIGFSDSLVLSIADDTPSLSLVLLVPKLSCVMGELSRNHTVLAEVLDSPTPGNRNCKDGQERKCDACVLPASLQVSSHSTSAKVNEFIYCKPNTKKQTKKNTTVLLLRNRGTEVKESNTFATRTSHQI